MREEKNEIIPHRGSHLQHTDLCDEEIMIMEGIDNILLSAMGDIIYIIGLIKQIEDRNHSQRIILKLKWKGKDESTGVAL